MQDKCPHCGNIYMDDAVFCRKCGTKRKDKTNPEEGFQRQISNETTASLERLDINVIWEPSPLGPGCPQRGLRGQPAPSGPAGLGGVGGIHTESQ